MPPSSPRSPSFSAHPGVTLLALAVILAVPMLSMHPATLAAALLGGALLTWRLRGAARLWSSAKMLLPTCALVAALNALFVHEGDTVLAALPWGSLTAESLAFGIASGALFSAMILWFGCLGALLTTDDVLSLAGRWAPTLALLLGMSLRFFPRFFSRLRETLALRALLAGELPLAAHSVFSSGGEKGSSAPPAAGSVPEAADNSASCPSRAARPSFRARARARAQQFRLAASSFTATLAWSLEDAIATADSLRARGYGLPGRNSYSPLRPRRRDIALLALLSLAGAAFLTGGIAGGFRFAYYPRAASSAPLTLSLPLLSLYLTLCLAPFLADFLADRSLRRSLSRVK